MENKYIPCYKNYDNPVDCTTVFINRTNYGNKKSDCNLIEIWLKSDWFSSHARINWEGEGEGEYYHHHIDDANDDDDDNLNIEHHGRYGKRR